MVNKICLIIALSLVCALAQANDTLEQYMIPEGYKVLNYLSPSFAWCKNASGAKKERCKLFAYRASEKASNHGYSIDPDYFLSDKYISAYISIQAEAKQQKRKGTNLRERLINKTKFNDKATRLLNKFKQNKG